MKDSAEKTPSGFWSRKINLKNLTTLLLVISIVLTLVFGWLFLKDDNPLENIYPEAVIVNEKPTAEYIFTLFQTENDTMLKDPSSTVVNDNKIYVADCRNRRIAVFNYNGNYKTQFGNTGPGKLQFPFGIAFTENEIYVTDLHTRKIHVFDLDGKFLRYFAEKAAEVPAAIYYRNDKFYLIDSASFKVIILDKAGKKLNSFGKRGGGKGELYYPFSISVNERNEIYVADSNNNRIQVFDEQGKTLKILTGKASDGGGGYSIPRGVAFDKAGNLYTAEMIPGRVLGIDKEGKTFLSIAAGNPLDGTGDLIRYPTSVFIDENQRLYVTEFGKSRVLVYRLK